MTSTTLARGWAEKLPWTQREMMAMRLSTTMTTTMSLPRWPFVERLGAPAEGLGKEGEEGAPPHGPPSAVLWGVHTSSPSGLFRVLRRNKGFNHDHRTSLVHKADTEAYKKVHGSKKRTAASVCEAKVEVTKDELSKLMSVGTELAKEIQEIKRAWVPKSDNKNKYKEKKGKKGGKKKGVNEVDAEESTPTPTSNAP